MWKSPMRALSSTTAKSQEMNSSKPPATAKPSTTAIVGLDRLNARSNVRAEIWAILTDWLVVPRNSEVSMFRSAPAQNVFPRPRITTARTSSSFSARSSSAPRPISTSQLMQFLTSGRLNQMVATGPTTWYWMISVACSTDIRTLSQSFTELTSNHTQSPLDDKRRRLRIGREADRLPYLNSNQAMAPPVRIPLPLPHIGSVNAWLLPGDPLTLIDTGACDDEALTALEAGLRRAGVRLEDIELVLVTHHHLDHSGLAATIAARSGARIAAYERAAAYGAQSEERGEADRTFSLALMRHHGVPQTVIDDTEAFWEMLRRQSDPFTTDLVLADGEQIRAGGRDLRVVARPGHSTTDALLVDDRERVAFVGDHLLAKISSNTEIYPALEPTGSRPRARVEYLESLRQTAAMPLERLHTGHGADITDHVALVVQRLADHERRCGRIVVALEAGETTAYGIAADLWPEKTILEQPLLVVWEVLGHLDLLLDAGRVREQVTEDGSTYGAASFALAGTPSDAH